jgi:AbrB family looped-hinge helix DNA binding protein
MANPASNTSPQTSPETSKVGKRGTLVIPAKLRQRFGLTEGSLVIAEATTEGILLRPAIALPTTRFTQEQIETLLLEGIASGDATDMTQADWDDLHRVAQAL